MRPAMPPTKFPTSWVDPLNDLSEWSERGGSVMLEVIKTNQPQKAERFIPKTVRFKAKTVRFKYNLDRFMGFLMRV